MAAGNQYTQNIVMHIHGTVFFPLTREMTMIARGFVFLILICLAMRDLHMKRKRFFILLKYTNVKCGRKKSTHSS